MITASFWTWHGWNALVAIGTLALALGTGVLGWMTKDAVDESKKQISLSRREVEAVEKQTAALISQIELAGRELTAVELQTASLVEQTAAVREQAEATVRQVAISTASLEASARPVLVGVTPTAATSGQTEEVVYTGGSSFMVEIERVHYQESGDMVFFSAPLRNVGSGVAFVQRVTVLAGNYDGRVSQVLIPAGGLTRARFALTLRENDGRRTPINEITAEGRGFVQFTIYVEYTGASRDLVAGTEVTFTQAPVNGFFVSGNEIYDGGTTNRKLLASTANVG